MPIASGLVAPILTKKTHARSANFKYTDSRSLTSSGFKEKREELLSVTEATWNISFLTLEPGVVATFGLQKRKEKCIDKQGADGIVALFNKHGVVSVLPAPPESTQQSAKRALSGFSIACFLLSCSRFSGSSAMKYPQLDGSHGLDKETLINALLEALPGSKAVSRTSIAAMADRLIEDLGRRRSHAEVTKGSLASILDVVDIGSVHSSRIEACKI